MATAACLPIVGDRAGTLNRTIYIVGLDLTGITLAMQIRLFPDQPGDPLVELATTMSTSAEGIRLVGVTTTDDVPTSQITIRILEATMQDEDQIRYNGEAGEASVLVYGLVGTFGGDVRTLLYGEFVALPTAYGSDAAPADRPYSYGSPRSYATWSIARVTFSDDDVTVTIDGADLFYPLLADAEGFADAAAASYADTSTALATIAPRARDLLDGETEGFALDGTTNNTQAAVYVKDLTTPANDFEGSIRAWLTDAGLSSVFPSARTVTFEGGTTGSSDAADVPYDWSQGERRLLIDADDNFEIPTTKIPALGSFYIEFGIVNVGATADQTPVELYDSGSGTETLFLTRTATASPIYHQMTTYSSAANSADVQGVETDLMAEGVISYAIRLEDNAVAISINGEAPRVDPRRQAPTANRIHLGGNFSLSPNHKLYLRRLISVPRLLDDDELGAWQRAAPRLHPVIRASSVVCRHGADAGDGATRAREPMIVRLAEIGDVASFMVFHMQKWGEDGDGHHLEAPARLMQRYYQYNRATGVLTSDTDSSTVFQEQAGWSTGLGHLQSPTGYKRTYGPRKGRFYAFWAALESGNGTFVPSELRNIRMAYSDKNGKSGTWSSPVQIVAGAAYAGEYLIPGPGSEPVEFPEGSTYSGRVAAVVYSAAGPRIIYTDNDASWTVGALPTGTPADRWANESVLTLLPNGSLLVISRVAGISSGLDLDDTRYWFLSTDGGATMAYGGSMPSFSGAAAAGGAVQIDPLGGHGTYGRTLLVRPDFTSGIPRHGALVSAHEDSSMASLDEFYASARFREQGYVAGASLFGGTYLAVTQEASFAGFNNSSTIVASIVELPERTAQP